MGRSVVFSVFEGAQGAADRNGDGDAVNTVLHVARPPFAATIETLRADLADSATSGAIGHGNAAALAAILESAARFADDGLTDAAAAQLHAFATMPNGLIEAGRVSEAVGRPLIDDALEIAEGLD